MKSVFLPVYSSDEDTGRHSEVDVDADYHEEEEQLQVVVQTAQT